MNNILYQVLHPWHWLTYGQNATAVAALATVLGLIGLFFYTRYTRRMMEMQESTARASITPVLVAQGDVKFAISRVEYSNPSAALIGREEGTIREYKGVLKIRNIGAGAALFLRGWHQSVSSKFVADGLSILGRAAQSKNASAALSELMHGEATTVIFEGLNPDELHQRWLFVVETIDQTNQRHQLQLLRTPVGDEDVEVNVIMVHQELPKRGGAKP